MRRIGAVVAAMLMVAAFAGSSVAAAPTYQVNHVVGDFDILNVDDGSVVGHVVVDYREPTAKRWVPGTLDVTWVDGAPFPYNQPPYGVKMSRTILTWAGFWLNRPAPDGDGSIQSGAGGSMCDFGAQWNATCHDFQIIVKRFTDGAPSLIAFGQGQGFDPSVWFLIGPGDFQLTFVGPTGS